MSTFYDFNQRVHLRSDPSRYGHIGCGGYGDAYDSTSQTQSVFWEHDGADIVTSEHVDDLVSEEELCERRRLFIAVMRRPEMRVLRLALRHLISDKGIDWHAIREIQIGSLPGNSWYLDTDRFIVLCLYPRNPNLTYEDFSTGWHHVEADPACMCMLCVLGSAYPHQCSPE